MKGEKRREKEREKMEFFVPFFRFRRGRKGGKKGFSKKKGKGRSRGNVRPSLRLLVGIEKYEKRGGGWEVDHRPLLAPSANGGGKKRGREKGEGG